MQRNQRLSGRVLATLAVLFGLGGVLHPVPPAAGHTGGSLTGFENPESAPWDGPSSSFYVSNIGPGPLNPLGREPDGYLSRISADGRLVARQWVTGLRSPKGIDRRGDDLLVADVGQLVVIDVAGARIRHTIDLDALGAQFPNDVAVDEGTGDAYVSDTLRNAIYRVPAGTDTAEVWLEAPELDGPNGLFVDGDRLMVASLGQAQPGRILVVELATQKITPLGNMAPLGRLDGLEKLGDDWIVTGDSTVWRVTPAGVATQVRKVSNAADLGLRPGDRVAAIPTLSDNRVVFTRVG